MTRRKPSPAPAAPAVSLTDLSPAEAFEVGASVGDLLKGGMPRSQALDATQTIADFIRRGQRAHAAVDAILAAKLFLLDRFLQSGRYLGHFSVLGLSTATLTISSMLISSANRVRLLTFSFH